MLEFVTEASESVMVQGASYADLAGDETAARDAGRTPVQTAGRRGDALLGRVFPMAWPKRGRTGR